MNAKKIFGFLVAVLVLVFATAPIQAQVATVGNIPGIASVSGEITRISPPSSVEEGELEDSDTAFVFIEKENFELTSDLTVNFRGTGLIDVSGDLRNTTIQDGSVINSYFIHFDRVGQPSTLSDVAGTIVFEENIIGVILLTGELNRSEAQLGAVRTEYGNAHGLEFSSQPQLSQDSVNIASDRRTLTFTFENNVQMDQMRVITGTSGSGGGDDEDEDAPNARSDSATTRMNRAVTIDVLDNDTDPNNDLDFDTLAIEDAPDDGDVTVDNDDGTIRYTPDRDFVGTDTFTYEICNADDLCDTATVTVEVTRTSDDDDDGGSQVTLRTLLPEADDCSRAEEASIDIVPGNRENFIRLDDEDGLTPVAILATEDFPAPGCVDVSSVTFGATGDEQSALSCGVVNVNFDRWPDIVCDFKTTDLGFQVGDRTGRLEADVVDGDFIDPTDDVLVLDVRRIKNFTPPRRPGTADVKALQIGQNLFVKSQNADAVSMQIQVFSTQGVRLHNDKSHGNVLRWSMRNAAGETLANGVYFYLVTAYDADGQVIGHTLNKIAIVR